MNWYAPTLRPKISVEFLKSGESRNDSECTKIPERKQADFRWISNQVWNVVHINDQQSIIMSEDYVLQSHQFASDRAVHRCEIKSTGVLKKECLIGKRNTM